MLLKKIVSFSLLMNFVLCIPVYSQDYKNNLRTKFQNNEAIIMEINIRSFNSQDIDADGFIREDLGEKRGTFLNAIDRLDEL